MDELEFEIQCLKNIVRENYLKQVEYEKHIAELSQQVNDLNASLTAMTKTANDHLNQLNAQVERGKMPTFKQQAIQMLVLALLAAPNAVYSEDELWDTAEELYTEGVKRGHYPRE